MAALQKKKKKKVEQKTSSKRAKYTRVQRPFSSIVQVKSKAKVIIRRLRLEQLKMGRGRRDE